MSRRVVTLAFLVTGVAGLVLQVAWFRLLAQSLGGNLTAVTVVLWTFMAGLAGGSFLFGRRAARLSDPVRTYALLELGVGVAALLTLPLLRQLDVAYALLARSFEGQDAALLGVKLALSAAALLPCTILMGGTLPVLCQALAWNKETAGQDTGTLYALNTAGAVLGTLLAAFLLLPALGLSTSVMVAAGLDLAVAAAVLALPRARDAAAPPPPAAPAPEGHQKLTLFAALLFVTGGIGIGYELLWTHLLAYYFGSGSHAFAVTLAVVLAGLAVGGFLGGALSDRFGRPGLVFAASQALLLPAILWQVWRFPDLTDFLYTLALRFERGISFPTLMILLLVGAVQVLLPAALCMGAALPSAVRAVVGRDGESGRVVGRLAAANTLGTLPGVVLAHLAIGALGTQGALLSLASASVVVAGLSASRGAGQRRTLVGLLTLAVLSGVAFLALAVDPHRVFRGSGAFVAGEGRSLLRIEESAHGTVSVERIADSRGTWKSLSIDGVNVAGTSPPLLSCQSLQGHLPLLLHGSPRTVLHVGFGSGGTAAAVATHASVARIDVAEINPTILRVASEEMAAVNGGVLEDARVVVHLVDARNYLVGTPRKFDCILSDSVHPRYQGNANLYTVEYFETCRAHLEEGGLVSAWLPIYSLSPDSLRSIVKSMRHVFPATSVWYLNSTVNEFVVIVGRMEPEPIDVARLARTMAEPSVASSLERVGIASPPQLLDFFVAEGGELDGLVGDVRLHHDDHPWVELESATILDREGSWALNFRNVVAARRSVVPHLRAGADFARDVERFEAATTHALAGQVHFLAKRWPEARAEFERALAINPEDREPWEAWGAPRWVRRHVGR